MKHPPPQRKRQPRKIFCSVGHNIWTTVPYVRVLAASSMPFEHRVAYSII